MPRTRCSRASMSTSVSAARFGRGRRGVAIGGSVVLRRLRLGACRLAVVRLGRLSTGRLACVGLGSIGLGSIGLGSIGLGGAGPGGPGRLLGPLSLLGLGLACLVALAVTGLAIAGLGVTWPAGPAPALRRGAAVLQRLGERGGEDLFLVAARSGHLKRPLGTGQALEALPIAGHLEELANGIGRLRANGKPVLRPVRIDLNERRVGLRVVLADLLDGTAIALGTSIGDDDPVVGLPDLAHAL